MELLKLDARGCVVKWLVRLHCAFAIVVSLNIKLLFFLPRSFFGVRLNKFIQRCFSLFSNFIVSSTSDFIAFLSPDWTRF
jgi:hypothetical protein